MQTFAGTINAPHFPLDAEWLNTERPLSWADLRGKIVILDFWTYCCINCLHVLPDLKRLERLYRDELVVIGVHSAKFTTERETENIRQAILRYEIDHPVINDHTFRLWSEYTVRAWPTLFIVDPIGKVVGYRSGEGVYEPFEQVIRRLIERFDERGLIDRRPLGLRRERALAAEAVLAYPGKVLADAASDRLFIADSNHNRIIVATLAGEVRATYGSGQAALIDGLAEIAAFHHPQGLALDGETLYVADTDNHAIRAIDLTAERVTTIAGSGAQARAHGRAGRGTSVPLNSPWDLVVHDGALYVAMAGPHQLWRIDLADGWAAPYAGAGHEALIDGPLAEAALAQPSGLASDGARLYVADSETSSLRSVDLSPEGRVATIVGIGLFEFGDVDGSGDAVRLQHPLGVAWHDGVLFVADTYNNKIKVVEPATRMVRSLLGDGRPGNRDGVGSGARLDEPGGVSVAGDRLYIADTNNHLIRVADLASGTVATLALTGLAHLPTAASEGMPARAVAAPPLTLAPGEASICVDVQPPPGYDLNADAPLTITLSVASPMPTGVSMTSRLWPSDLPAHLTASIRPETRGLSIDMVAYFCRRERAAVCLIERVRLTVPIVLTTDDGGRPATITHFIPAPER